MPDSTVQFINIDEEFPIAGQDNDSQGFRDNFSEIKEALENTNLELTDLLTNSARLDNNNNFNRNDITNANLREVSYEVGAVTAVTNTSTADWENGNYQNITISVDTTLELTGWSPTNTFSSMRLALRSNDANPKNVSFNTGGTLKISPGWPTETDTIVVDSSTDPTFVEAWTSDQGLTVYLLYLGKFTTVA
jgi:hypothetical protein